MPDYDALSSLVDATREVRRDEDARVKNIAARADAMDELETLQRVFDACNARDRLRASVASASEVEEGEIVLSQPSPSSRTRSRVNATNGSGGVTPLPPPSAALTVPRPPKALPPPTSGKFQPLPAPGAGATSRLKRFGARSRARRWT